MIRSVSSLHFTSPFQSHIYVFKVSVEEEEGCRQVYPHGTMDEYNFSWLRGVDFWVTPDLVSGHERLRHEGHPLSPFYRSFTQHPSCAYHCKPCMLHHAVVSVSSNSSSVRISARGAKVRNRRWFPNTSRALRHARVPRTDSRSPSGFRRTVR